MELIEIMVIGFGYELVEFECIGCGMFCIYIDQFVGILFDDCEKVMCQFQYVLMVENIDYEWFEVLFLGFDCLLKKLVDFECFVGSEVFVILKKLLDGCKMYWGILYVLNGEMIGLEFEGKKGEVVMLDFMLVDIDKVCLIL